MRKSLLALCLLAYSFLALAQGAPPSAVPPPLLTFTPEGVLRAQTRMEAVFSTSMVEAGTQAAPPLTVQCKVPGKGRWETDKRWVYQLERSLVTGEHCTFTPIAELKDRAGATVQVKKGGYVAMGPELSLELVAPGAHVAVQEDQVFVIRASAAVDWAELDGKAWCQTSTSPEKVPLVAKPEALAILLKEKVVHQEQAPRDLMALGCQQTLVQGSKLRLVFAAGLKSKQGDPLPLRRTFDFKVAEPFKATVSCSRPKPQAPCDPFSPVQVVFNHQVPKETAQAIALTFGSRTLKPTLDFEGDESPNYVRDDASVNRASFPGPFPEKVKMTVTLPPNILSTEGMQLVNKNKFPMQVAMGPRGALGKFSGDFGILELNEGGVLPLTVRRLEKKLALSGTTVSSSLSSSASTDDREVMQMIARLRSFTGRQDKEDPSGSDNRRESFFAANAGSIKHTPLPAPTTTGEMEVLGIPLATPGFHVVELSSQLLGKALLPAPAPMYVRTSALVTNMALHFKRGSDSSVAWVTQLDSGAPVAGASVTVRSCTGTEIWTGTTDRDGLARIGKSLEQPVKCPPDFGDMFVSARKGNDYSFVLDSWGAGVETWRFGVEQASDESFEGEGYDDFSSFYGRAGRLNAHTIFDRTLFKRGETLSMKHLLRWQSEQGLARPDDKMLFKEVVIQHLGSGDKYTLPVTWDGYAEASSQWSIPRSAKLGTYRVSLRGGAAGERETGMIRVSDFKLPAFTGQLTAERGKTPQELVIKSNLAFMDAGPAKGQPVKYTVVSQTDWSGFTAPKGFEGYKFGAGSLDEAAEKSAGRQPCVIDTVLVDAKERVLNAKGEDVFVPALPKFGTSCLLKVEMSFFDPSGQTSSLQSAVMVYPTSYIVGMKAKDGKLTFVSLNITGGKSLAHVKLKVQALQSVTYTHRRKVVGGFYAYSSDTVVEDRGPVCAGMTDGKGGLSCQMPAALRGDITLQVTAQSASGEQLVSKFETWAGPREGPGWENPSSDDRMTLMPDKPKYQVGEVARLTASVPFQSSWALVTVEREGVLLARVQQLTRDKSTVELPLEARYAPNVYTGVLAVRGRISQDAKGQPVQPTAMLDLGKPAFRAALAELQVDIAANVLKLTLEPTKAAYKPRETVEVRVKATQADGTPAKDARVSVAVVDAALLELSPNNSYKTLHGMYASRANTVSLFTSQLQVVGKRHYGKKAVPFGGSGGRRAVRELFDALVYWNPAVQLDAKGEAVVHFKLNDSLTRFEVTGSVAGGLEKFGDGRASLVSQQDIQLRATLPQLVRLNDDYQASATLRNASGTARTVHVQGFADDRPLSERPVTLKPNESQEVFWQVRAPDKAATVNWRFVAKTGAVIEDEMAIKQSVVPVLLPALVSSDLVKVDKTWSLPLGQAADAIAGQSQVKLSLSNSVVGDLGRVTEFFDAYPHACLEQETSRALGYADAKRFGAVMDSLPAYIGAASLANYFPGESRGSEALTAYLLISGHAAGWTVPQDSLDRLLNGLTAYVRQSAKHDVSMESRLYAMEALARYKRLDASLLSAQTKTLEQLGSDELVSLYAIHHFAGPLKNPAFSGAALQQELHKRLGSKGVFDERRMYGYNSDYLASLRLIELTANDLAFAELLTKAVAQTAQTFNKRRYFSTQEYGWTRLALNKAEAALGARPLTGKTRVTLAAMRKEQSWAGKVLETMDFTLPYSGTTTVNVAQDASGPAFLRYEVRQAQPLKEPLFAGIEVTRKVEVVEGKLDALKRGDVLRVTLTVKSPKPLEWVAISDPVPAGAAVMDRAPLKSEKTGANVTLWPTYEEKGYGFYRAYFEHLWGWQSRSEGTVGTLQYFVRINTPGVFHLPETRVEAMYDPDTFARLPNQAVTVKP